MADVEIKIKPKLQCPKCQSVNIRKKCCGRRACNDCGAKWSIRKK